jgi:hypothetical protein
MAFIVEDGSGLAEANSYVSVEWADAYFQMSMDRAEWEFLDRDDKIAALVTATATIDDYWDFGGWPLRLFQSPQFPRYGIRDRTSRILVRGYEVPLAIKQATADLALFLRRQRDAATTAKGEAVSKIEVGPIAVTMTGQASSTTVITSTSMPRTVSAKLTDFGSPAYGYVSGRLVR